MRGRHSNFLCALHLQTHTASLINTVLRVAHFLPRMNLHWRDIMTQNLWLTSTFPLGVNSLWIWTHVPWHGSIIMIPYMVSLPYRSPVFCTPMPLSPLSLATMDHLTLSILFPFEDCGRAGPIPHVHMYTCNHTKGRKSFHIGLFHLPRCIGDFSVSFKAW